MVSAKNVYALSEGRKISGKEVQGTILAQKYLNFPYDLSYFLSRSLLPILLTENRYGRRKHICLLFWPFFSILFHLLYSSIYPLYRFYMPAYLDIGNDNQISLAQGCNNRAPVRIQFIILIIACEIIFPAVSQQQISRQNLSLVQAVLHPGILFIYIMSLQDLGNHGSPLLPFDQVIFYHFLWLCLCSNKGMQHSHKLVKQLPLILPCIYSFQYFSLYVKFSRPFLPKMSPSSF